MSHTVIKNQTIRDLAQGLEKGAKKSAILTGAWDAPYASGITVVDGVLGKAEVHLTRRDIWYVISGRATFILGGELVDPEGTKPGEFVSFEITDGEHVSVEPGDVIDIPPTVPHQIDARGSRIELLIVKSSN